MTGGSVSEESTFTASHAAEIDGLLRPKLGDSSQHGEGAAIGNGNHCKRGSLDSCQECVQVSGQSCRAGGGLGILRWTLAMLLMGSMLVLYMYRSSVCPVVYNEESCDIAGRLSTSAVARGLRETASVSLRMKDFLGATVIQAAPQQSDVEDDAICAPDRPLTEPGWSPRAWHVSEGEQMACESRNRVKDNGHTIRYDNWDRNWCWVGVKEQCHSNLKTPRSWATWRKEAFKNGMAPSPEDAPFSGLENEELCDGTKHGIPKPYHPDDAKRASAWFRKHVKVYVLNLPKFYNRWDVVSKRLWELGIAAERVIGVDMQEPGSYNDAKAKGWIPRGFDIGKTQAKAFSPEQQVGKILGTVGCAAAHFKAQGQILYEKPTLGLVLEDDSWLMDDFVVQLWRIVTQELPCDWDVLQLLGRCSYGKCVSEHLARIQPDANEPKRICHEGVNWGMHGVLYRTEHLEKIQWKWKQTVFNPEVPHCLDIDVALASISDEVNYYSIPNSQQPGLLKEMDLGSVRASINLGFRVGN
ncbi:unnamed protein product [Symbiodinium pilosum]|uniref:Uncharacterized protein n=1 Tax=Symbiodinium pilosum TaxID=2952 RepID=A0A812MZR6_SYMPI|nr:unnamed protein product [Symbiodinium pilosum]